MKISVGALERGGASRNVLLRAQRCRRKQEATNTVVICSMKHTAAFHAWLRRAPMIQVSMSKGATGACEDGRSALPYGMPYRITITEDAERHLRALSAREQRIVEAAIIKRLEHQPTTPTKAIKLLRPNPFAAFELRAGDLRALYNVENDEVVVLLVGRKEGNKLIVEGEEFHVHQDNPAEPSGNGSKNGTD